MSTKTERPELPPLASPVAPEQLKAIRTRDERWQRAHGPGRDESPAADRRLLLIHINALEAQVADLEACAEIVEEIYADYQTMKKILRAQYIKSLENEPTPSRQE